jgi:hypothetical protein
MKIKRIASLAMGLWVLVVVTGSAQVEEAAQNPEKVQVPELRDELKAFTPFIGTWEIDGEWLSGEKIWARSEYKVGMEGNFVEARTWTRGEDGQAYQRYLTIWRWDTESSKVTSHGFTFDGSYTGIDTEVNLVDGVGTLKSNWKMGETGIEQVVQTVDANHYSWKVWSMTGETKTLLMDGVWKRVE